MLDYSWLDALELRADEDLLVIAAGVLMYLAEADVRAFVARLVDAVPRGELLLEAVAPLVVRAGAWHPTVSQTSARLGWGVRDLRDLEAWAPGLRLVGSWHLVDQHPRRWRWMRLFRRVPALRRLQHVGRFRWERPT
jgi:O-methyltransferase